MLTETAKNLLTPGGLSVLLLLVQVVAQGQLSSREFGTAYNAGPRDEGRKPQGIVAGRADRALRNLLETYPAFLFLILALALQGEPTRLGVAAVWLWLAARIAHFPLYLAGVPYLRSVAWLISVASLLMMLAALFF